MLSTGKEDSESLDILGTSSRTKIAPSLLHYRPVSRWECNPSMRLLPLFQVTIHQPQSSHGLLGPRRDPRRRGGSENGLAAEQRHQLEQEFKPRLLPDVIVVVVVFVFVIVAFFIPMMVLVVLTFVSRTSTALWDILRLRHKPGTRASCFSLIFLSSLSRHYQHQLPSPRLTDGCTLHFQKLHQMLLSPAHAPTASHPGPPPPR